MYITRFHCIIFFSLCWQSLFAFTLISSDPPLYGENEVLVDLTSDSCSNTGYTPLQLFNLIQETLDEFWNQVSTSRLHLRVGAIVPTIAAHMTSPSDIVKVAESNHILVGCSSEVPEFAQGNIGAVGVIAYWNGATRGGVLVNDAEASRLSNLPVSQMKALLAHELGHALGIGHSEDNGAVMYYSVAGKLQEHLSEDDFDALSYLYPSSFQQWNPFGLTGAGGGNCGGTPAYAASTSNMSHKPHHRLPYFFAVLIPLLIAMCIRGIFSRFFFHK